MASSIRTIIFHVDSCRGRPPMGKFLIADRKSRTAAATAVSQLADRPQMAVRTSSRPESAWCLSSIPVTACHERPLRGKSKSQTFPKTSSGADGRLKIQPLAKHTFRSGNPHVLGFIREILPADRGVSGQILRRPQNRYIRCDLGKNRIRAFRPCQVERGSPTGGI